MKPQLYLAGAVLAAGMIASPAWAGLVMVYEQESYGRPGKETSTMYVGKDAMRTESKGSGRDQVFIFRGDRKLFWMIDNREGTYTEITREDLKKMKGRMDEAMKEYEEQMKNVPPEQRQMVEAMMKGRMPQKPPRTAYKKVASGVKVNRWNCDRYDGYLGREKNEEVWTADAGQLDLRPEELQVLDDVRDFMEEFSKQDLPFFRAGKGKRGKEGSDLSGVPVRMIRYADGKKHKRMELTEVQRKDVAPSLFEVPAGMKKKEIVF